MTEPRSASNTSASWRFPLGLALALALAGLSFVAGRASAPKPPVAKVRTPSPTLATVWQRSPVSDLPRPKAPRRNVVVPPIELAQVQDDAAAEQLRRYEREQSADLVKLLRTRVKRIAFTAGDREVVPEAFAVQMAEYSAGWMDAVIRTAPSLADDLAHEIETVQCDPASSEGERLLLARLGRHMPELTSSTGLACMLGEGAREDAVLWEALDALGGSGLPAPKEIDALRARATDERTLRRLRRLDEAAAPELRVANGQGTVSEYIGPHDAPPN